MSDELDEAPETELPLEETAPDEEAPRNEDSPASEDAGKPESVEAKRLKDTQRALTQKSQELAEIKERMARIEGHIEASRPERQAPQGERLFSFFDDETVKQTLLDDPENIVKLVKSSVTDVIKMLKARDEAFSSMVRKQSPEMLAVRDKVAELAKDPDYQDFSEEQLAVIARKMTKSTGNTPRPGPGSRRASAPGGDADFEREVNSMMKRIYGEDE
jgi:hypothetical protein